MLKPLNNYVIVKVTQAQEKTLSGIILTNVSNNNVGVVESVGPLSNKEIKIGQTVVFKQECINRVDYEGIEYLIINDNDIISIIE